MSPPVRRFSGSRLAHGLVWRRDRMPTDAATWDRWLDNADRVVDLGTDWRALLFDPPRRIAQPPPHADLLVAVGAGLSTIRHPTGAPLSPGEVEVAEHGQREVHRPGGSGTPSPTLFSVGPIQVLPLSPLGRPPTPPPARTPGLGVVSRRLGLVRTEPQQAHQQADGSRSRVGDWLARTGGRLLREALAIFRPDAPRPPLERPPPMQDAVGRSRPRFMRLRSLFRGLLRGVGSLLSAAGVVVAGIAAALLSPFAWLGSLGATRPQAPPAPRRPGLLSRIWDRLSGFGRIWSISRWLDRQHARLLQELVDWFDSGDLLEALRRAVPLGGDGDGPPTGWFFGRLRRRDALLPTGRSRARGAIRAQEQVVGLLRRLYEDAHQQLDADGDIERAAWVLAELLGDKERCVSYLQSRDRHRLAAEWGELMAMPAERCVWLWLWAREPDRALRHGRMRGQLRNALMALEAQGDLPLVLDLRTAWATEAWQVKNPRLAVELTWPMRLVSDGPPIARWLRESVDQPEHVHWALPAALSLGILPDGIDRLEALLASHPDSRAAVARQLCRWPFPDKNAVDTVLRAILTDLPEHPAARRALDRLLHDLPSGTHLDLRADLPELPATHGHPSPAGQRLVVPTPRRGGPRPVDLRESETGTLTVLLGRQAVWRKTPGRHPHLLATRFDRLIHGPGRTLAAVQHLSSGTEIWWLDAEGPPEAAPFPPELAVHPSRDPEGLLWTHDHHAIQCWQLARHRLQPVWESFRGFDKVLALEVLDRSVHAVVQSREGLQQLSWDRTAGMVLRWRRPVNLSDIHLNAADCHLADGRLFVDTQDGVLHVPSGRRLDLATVLAVHGAHVVVAVGHELHLWNGDKGPPKLLVTHDQPPSPPPVSASTTSNGHLLVGWDGGSIDLIDVERRLHLDRWEVGRPGR